MSLFNLQWQEMDRRLKKVAEQSKPQMDRLKSRPLPPPSELSAMLNEIMKIQVTVRGYYTETFATAWLLETGCKATHCRMCMQHGNFGIENVWFESYAPPEDGSDYCI